jgi:hypothetical protein
MERSCTTAVHLFVTEQRSKKMRRENEEKRKTSIYIDTATGRDRERESGRQAGKRGLRQSTRNMRYSAVQCCTVL